MEPKIHYRVNKSPPLIPNLSQMNPVQTLTSSLYKIYFNILVLIIPFFRLSHQNFQVIISHACYMTIT
jgi:hypothetical protein